MKKFLIYIPILFLVAFALIFYTNVNKNAEIKKSEAELLDLQVRSHELLVLHKNSKQLILHIGSTISYDEISKSNKELKVAIQNYRDVLASLNFTRLYKISKNIEKKSVEMVSILEDIKTDMAVVKSLIFLAHTSYNKYTKNTKSLSESDKEYMNALFSAVLKNPESEPVEFKQISLVQNADDLNVNLRKIYLKQKSLMQLERQMAFNDIAYDINEVIAYSYKKSNELRNETNGLIKNFLMATLLLLLFAVIVYVKELIDSKKLRVLSNELKQFSDALDESAIVSKSDLSGKITYVNDRFCEISGYNREELIGKQHNIVRHEDTDSEIFKILWETIQAKRVFRGTIKNRTKSGSSYYVDTTITPLLDIDGEIIEYLSVRYDITMFISFEG